MSYSSKTNICEHCNGWGVQHIPVTNNIEQCNVCKGMQVFINYRGKELYWGKGVIIDQRPQFLTKKFLKSTRFKNLVLFLIVLVLIVFIINLIDKNFYADLWSHIQKLLGIN